MANQIQMRHDTLANWQSSNPVLLLGEIGYISDKKYIVIGDGATAFNSLTPWSPTANVTAVSSSPYTITGAAGLQIYIVNSTANPCVINLPAAVGGGGEIEIFDASLLSTGLVKILPSSGDAIGQLAANVAAYLQNVDQSGGSSVMQSLRICDVMAGRWSVAGGQFAASSVVDAFGSQYELGKLHHLPLGNATSRSLGDLVPTAQNSWYASAITATGVAGIPAGAKGIRVRVAVGPYATSSPGNIVLVVCFSDNNSSTPTADTGHPLAGMYVYVSLTGGCGNMYSELDIPLSPAGKFYMYTLLASGVTVASSVIAVRAVGYYMGD